MRTRTAPAIALFAALVIGAAGSNAAAPGTPPLHRTEQLANSCVAIGDATGSYYLKPTALRRYLIQDSTGSLLAASGSGVSRTAQPGPEAEWTITRVGRRFVIHTPPPVRPLGVDSSGQFVIGGSTSRLRLFAASGCLAYPEAAVGAKGRTFSGANPDGTVRGFADLHLHPVADFRAGGQVIAGEAFDRFGITEALGRDVDVHGPDGSLDITGNLLRTGSPAGTHETEGWPSFAGWPTYDTLTHQQVYYRWLERAWMAGLRLVVAQTVEDQPLCDIEPRRSHSCDETETIKLEIQRLRELQDYVDAQSGGGGRGWFRIVDSPERARRVIERGKLAVVIGVESSNPLGCSERNGEPLCTRPQIKTRLHELHQLGVRSMFVTHWTDNALGGPAFEGGAKGEFIGLMQQSHTGHPFATEPCTTGDEDEGMCNAKGLTDLGGYLVRRMIAEGMLIEADHMSQRTRAAVFAIAKRNDHPLVSSHTGTGGEWTPSQLRALRRLGGISSVTPGSAGEMIGRVRQLRRNSGEADTGIALGSDTGGFAELPGPPTDAAANPLIYPFRSFEGNVRFERQRTGTRSFDYNLDGVAQYGLFADLFADIERRPGGQRALDSLFSSAETFLQTWEQASHR